MVAFTWRGAAAVDEVVNLGPLALIEPLLDRLNIEAIIDRHLPPDPQLEYSHGQVLSVLLAARLCQPTALVNVAGWAEKSGAAIFANVPADKLNDDRLGRALDAFFDQRHSILGSITAQALHVTRRCSTRTPALRPHQSAVVRRPYRTSTPRPDWQELPPVRWASTGRPHRRSPAIDCCRRHLCHGYSDDRKMMQIGQLAVVDELRRPCRCWHTASTAIRGTAIPPSTRPSCWHQQHLALPDHMAS